MHRLVDQKYLEDFLESPFLHRFTFEATLYVDVPPAPSQDSFTKT